MEYVVAVLVCKAWYQQNKVPSKFTGVRKIWFLSLFFKDSMNLMNKWLLSGKEWLEWYLYPFSLFSLDTNWRQWYAAALCYLELP